MAIYRLEVKMIQRSQGHSVVAAAAYRGCSRLVDEQTGEIQDYTRKDGHAYNEIIQPEGIGEITSQELWNKVENDETKINASLARDFLLTLPRELSSDVRRQLSVDFTQWLVERYNVQAELNIHEPTVEQRAKNAATRCVPVDDLPEQPHAHILVSTRDVFGKKLRVLADKKTGRQEIKDIRKKWEVLLNAELVPRGFPPLSCETKETQDSIAAEEAKRILAVAAKEIPKIKDEIKSLSKIIQRQERFGKFQRFAANNQNSQNHQEPQGKMGHVTEQRM
ncbi:MobA/MobL family protein [Desulfovibrio aerotolerans]|uniref:MobA/MobL family protein n=1 Tax=Solidesulfovibrio aerotolerans TaxID=295255 RepID=A0A7C9MRA5_9BACT|nr:MobA/MobL family protein [Solidesulfovibrio aerotolerans]MYL85372.1 MobA/MobL family protein [Solidesulfovibrio aerotolerans]